MTDQLTIKREIIGSQAFMVLRLGRQRVMYSTLEAGLILEAVRERRTHHWTTFGFDAEAPAVYYATGRIVLDQDAYAQLIALAKDKDQRDELLQEHVPPPAPPRRGTIKVNPEYL
jgi:hypothetical protein